VISSYFDACEPALRVLFIVDTLGAGGAERSLQELLTPLSKSGVRPIVACFAHRAEGIEHLLQDFDVHFLSGPRARQMFELRRIARRDHVELVHTSLFEADVFGRTSLIGLNLPIVTSLVNMPYEPARLEHDPNVNARKLAAVRLLEMATARATDAHFHAITEAVKRSAVHHLHIDPRKITVVHRGRDPERLGRRTPERRRRWRETLGISPDTFVVLNAARQEYQKGQRFLLQAFPRLLEARPDSVLLVAGRSGNASADLKPLAQRLGERVRFLGHRDDLPDMMAAADAFALPSLWEGLGGVLLEALALELPIVASDLEPVREIVEDRLTARLVPPQQVVPLAEALLEVASDDDTTGRMAQAGRLLFERSFTLDKSAERMLGLFQKVRSERVGGRP